MRGVHPRKALPPLLGISSCDGALVRVLKPFLVTASLACALRKAYSFPALTARLEQSRPRRQIVLELAFATKALRTLCEDQVEAAEELGDKLARVLRNRVADLRAANHPLDLPVGQPRVGTGHESENVLVDLTDGYRLVLRCNHLTPPRARDGTIVWNRVSRVQLLRIEGPSE
jgi:hypothetical protein